MKTLSTKAFESVTQLFHSVSGIKLGPQKQALVAGRLQRLAQEAGEADVDAYVEKVLRGETPAHEMTRVIDRLTTNETYFFREPQHFNDLQRRLSEHRGNEAFKVWSAASSSGEEAFSTAMVLADTLGRRPWQVIGTDLSTAMVESATRALFVLERARMVPADYLKRYCLKGQGQHEGSLLIVRELREQVRFLQANLMQDLPELPLFDVIFLRNVLIYFDNEAKSQIVRRVLGRLKPDGVIYIGHAESMSTLNVPLRPLGTAIYGHA